MKCPFECIGSACSMDIITLMTLIPTFGALLILFFPRMQAQTTRILALAASSVPLIFSFKILMQFDPGNPAIQMKRQIPWIPSLGVDYFVGIDGLSLAMVLLTSIIMPLALLGSYRWISQPRLTGAGHRPFLILILLQQTGLYGAFTALNFFHWFIFWEICLVPMFFLIKFYGNEDRTAASYQFFVYTFIGSVAMLLGMQFIYLATDTWNFNELAQMAKTSYPGAEHSMLVHHIQAYAGKLGVEFIRNHSVTFIFALVFLGFAFKVPLWPFHTWLPISYTQAPTAGSMILTGLMSKMGVYGFLRIVLPLFGDTMARYAAPLMILSVLTILLAALASLSQRDIKAVISYSSISHLGYCLMGIFAVASMPGPGYINDKAIALNGVILMMFAHGLSGAGLFFLAGLIEQRTGTRAIDELGGLRKTVPVMTGLFGIIMFASLGLPGLAGFVGEFMIFRGAFPLSMELTCVAVVGILLTALYLLRMTSMVFFGPKNDKWSSIPDLTPREIVIAGILALLLFLAGVLPAPLVKLSNTAAVNLVSQVK